MNDSPHDLLACWLLVKRASTDSRLSAGGVAVLISILDRMNSSGAAWPSLNRIAADASVSRMTVVRSVKALVDFGYLQRESGSRVNSNRYRLGSNTDVPTGRRSDEPTGSNTDVPGVGTNRCLEVGTPVFLKPTHKNLPIEPTQKHIRKAQAPADRFAEFYAVYPRHEKRPAAEKSWKRQNLDAVVGSIITDVQARLAEGGPWRGTEKRFIPLPATYLNDRRWEDEWKPAGGAGGAGRLARDHRSEDEIAAANEAALARFGGGA